MPQRLYDAANRGDAAAVAEFLREGDDAMLPAAKGKEDGR